MAHASQCVRCGAALAADSLGGECPACLMELSLAPEAEPNELAADELQSHFPQYEMLGRIGRGGMGVVYKARHAKLQRLVAIKLLAAERARDPAFAERFFREAQALARLNHPNIVAVYDVGSAADTVFIEMEYVDGSSLRERLATGRLTPSESLRIIPQICEAIQFAHDRGVIHRDIKPENVLIDDAGRVKIADFGLAKLDGDGGHNLTDTNERLGTARYMAPEQWTNTGRVDHRADIYSLGVLFYEMLTGDLPTVQFQPPSSKAGTDPRLDVVVAKSLKDEPAHRYQKAAEIKTEVERIAVTPLRAWWKWAAAAAGVLLVGIAVALALRGPRGDSTPQPTEPPASSNMLTSAEYEWTVPVNAGPPVNTPQREVAPCLSADGLSILFASDRPGTLGDLDLWEAKRPSIDQPFGTPVNLGPVINTPGTEDSPTLSADGRMLVFASNRSGMNNSDMFLATRPSPGEPWGEAVNLGPEVNSAQHEFRPWLSADGLRLTFNSLRPPREGVYVCGRSSANEPFRTAAPLGRNHATMAVGSVSFSADDRFILVHRFNSQYRGNLLWLGQVDSLDAPFRNLRSFGPVVNSESIDVAPVLAPDGRTVFFQSNRSEGEGESDIWYTRRVAKGK
jgi:serine/threonine protein kinase